MPAEVSFFRTLSFFSYFPLHDHLLAARRYIPICLQSVHQDERMPPADKPTASLALDFDIRRCLSIKYHITTKCPNVRTTNCVE